MKIQVTKILSDHSQQPLVEFQSAYGVGRALWADGIPQLFQDYDVEYELPEMLVWEQTIVASNEEFMAVGHQENALILCGELDRDDEGGWFLRIGTSLIQLEIETTKRYTIVPRFIKITSQNSIIYDTHL